MRDQQTHGLALERRTPTLLRRGAALGVCVGVCVVVFAPRRAVAQGGPTTRLLILQAEERRATTTADLSTIRVSARSGNPDTARAAIRSLGRLERVSLIPDILPGLRHSLPEVRAEAANALAQAAQGLRGSTAPPQPGMPNILLSTQSSLIGRLSVEDDANVRGALCEALARLPYRIAADAERAERAILELSTRATAVADRLGLAKALEAFVRLQGAVRPPSADVIAELRDLAHVDLVRSAPDPLRDARLRRLALEALTAAGAVDDLLVEHAAEDADPQVRRLAMRASAVSGAGQASIQGGLLDRAPMVRLEALRALRVRDSEATCAASVKAAADDDMMVALVAIDQLGACARSDEAVAYLTRTVADLRDLAVPRGWHRNAHALVALAAAAPERAASWLPSYAASGVWQVRLYAARAASQVGNQSVLERLAADADDRVANIALAGLGRAPRPARSSQDATRSPVTGDEIRRLAAPRARITIRDVGRFELALFTSEAPGTVIRFAKLAEAGYYNGLSFDRLAPNAIAQAGERTSGETATYPGRETGTWPHVRGTVGIAAPDTGDAQFFINLIDNPRFDHQYTVFAQILNGADVVDRILEGDVIESIEILPLMFSGRVPGSLRANRLSTELARLGEQRQSILDLTLSNPTRAGLAYPDDLLEPLGHRRGLDYAPQPLGLLAARSAVSGEYARQGLAVSPEQIVLTASTSEAYSLLFKVLCDPGDEVLVPRPSYPLFEHLTRLDAVTPVPYDLEYHGAWSIDLAGVERALTPRTRVLLLVNPNNPTGHFVSTPELDRIAALAASHDLVVIADEVFADYELTPGTDRRAGRLAERPDILSVTLGGLSKSIGLPQAKLAWMVLGGPASAVAQARARLELVCDTYLSVSTPVQAAAAELLASGSNIRRQIQSRVTINYRHLIARGARTPSCRVLNADGGWYAVLQVPSLMSEEDLVLSLLTDDSVLAHPGYFFDFPSESFLIVSLLPREAVFSDAIDRVLRRFDHHGTWP